MFDKKRQGAQLKVGYNPATRVFSEEDETVLTSYLLKASAVFFGLTPLEVRKLAYQWAVKKNIKVPQKWLETEVAGVEWFSGFLKRNPELSIRSPQPTSLSRATSLNRANVKDYFDKLTGVLDRHKIEPSRIWNIDETGCTTVQKPAAIVAAKGAKQVGGMTSGERGQLVTVCAAVSATGNTVPPMFVFPRVHYHAWFIRDDPVGCAGSANKSG